jgi:hypothetical protein
MENRIARGDRGRSLLGRPRKRGTLSIVGGNPRYEVPFNVTQVMNLSRVVAVGFHWIDPTRDLLWDLTSSREKSWLRAAY